MFSKVIALLLGPDFMIVIVETADHDCLSLKLLFHWFFAIRKEFISCYNF